MSKIQENNVRYKLKRVLRMSVSMKLTMASVGWTVVSVLLACACAALAMPDFQIIDLQNSIQRTPPTTNTVSHLKEPAPAPAASKPPLSIPVNERFPHAVLFGRTCGGTVISPKWVLSAGHCTLFTGGRYVLAGTNTSDDGSGVEVRVKRLVVHPRFSVGPYWLDPDAYDIKQVAARFDFLLAELEHPLVLDGKKIAAAPLDELLRHPAGENVGYAGYGAEKHGETMRHDMHGMDMVTVSDEACASKLEQFDADDMLCATGKPPRFDSACNGDSGSGLVSGGRLLGVASWVENDAHKCFNGAFVVFSRVARARDWIRQVTGV